MSKARGFSLVEVAAALGIVAFALLSIIALLPIGLESNRIASEETRAVNILTVLDADLRNTFSTTGSSRIFALPSPYKASSETAAKLTSNAPVLNTLHTIGLMENETVTPAAPGARFQVSVVYTKIPPPGSLESADARLIVSWPCLAGATISDLTDHSHVSGYVESYVSFPAP